MAALAAREAGKPLTEARGPKSRGPPRSGGSTPRPLTSPPGPAHDPAAGAGLLLTRRRPHGVAGLITPWKVPLRHPELEAARALAVGNAVVLKPAPEQRPALSASSSPPTEPARRRCVHLLPGGATEGNALVSAPTPPPSPARPPSAGRWRAPSPFRPRWAA
ncbi:aldehyde dehydrogenase family protein [Streptomyces flavidovirens]|uniref:aldehyde dehydrogenase family protein n=1 Tax=Streptomyces flavidovirens TaxID=67298 RepID=UPI003CC606F6